MKTSNYYLSLLYATLGMKREAARESVAPFDLRVVADRYSELCVAPPSERARRGDGSR